MATEPLAVPIGGCGGEGEPACPPIDCIRRRNSKVYAVIAGVEYELTLTGQPTAEEQAAQETQQAT